MENIFQNIVLMAVFIGIAVFLDFIIRKVCDMIEYMITEQGEAGPSQPVYYLSISPYMEKISPTEESDHQEDHMPEVDENDSDRHCNQDGGDSGAGLFIRVTKQSEGHPYSSPICHGQPEGPYSPIRG